MGAGMRTEGRRTKEIPMKTGLNTKGIPIMGTSNTTVSKSEKSTRQELWAGA